MADRPEIRNRVFDADYDRGRQKKRSKLKERRAAKVIGASRQPGSGCDARAKGDLQGELVLAEHKFTAKKSLAIKREWLEKISIEAMAVGRTPAFAFTFDQWDKEVLVPRDWIAVPAEFLRSLMEESHG